MGSNLQTSDEVEQVEQMEQFRVKVGFLCGGTRTLYRESSSTTTTTTRTKPLGSSTSKRKAAVDWLASIPPELLLPDLETLERLSRGEPADLAQRQPLLFESELETIRRRKQEADAQARKDSR
jgi:hypothetical protein